VRWDRFFEDLEDQLAAEWEAERAALDSEAERVRVARLELRERLRALVSSSASCTVEAADGTAVAGTPSAVGADWIAVRTRGRRETVVLLPLHAVSAVTAEHGEVLRSARPGEPEDRLSRRVTFGFALRDLARRRLPVCVGVLGPRTLSGTIDRVGVDHLDLALHEEGAPRRASAVTGFRVLAFAAVSWVRVDAAAARRPDGGEGRSPID
jgi:hypothetical protein